MKKLLLLLSILSLFVGCGTQTTDSVPAMTAAPAPSPSVWGETASTVVEAATTSTPAPTPEPSPSPSPTPQPTFLELQQAGPRVQLQYPDAELRPDPYLEVESVLVDELSYVKLSDLQQVYSWLSSTDSEDGLHFSTAYGGTTDTFRSPITFRHIALTGLSGRCIQTDDGLWVPLRAIAQATGLYLLWDSETRTSYVSQIPNVGLITQGVRVPTLMYHEVANETWGLESLFVTPDNMRAQLQYLKDNGYDTIFFSDLMRLSDFDKPVLLTFDDGYTGNYENLFPLLKEFNMKATIFVILDMLDTPNYLTTAQVQEMADSGLVSIQSHTMTHMELGVNSYDDQHHEIRQSQLEIARITGRTPYVLSYPYGSFNDDTRSIAPWYYSFALKSLGGTWVTESSDYFTIERTNVPRSAQISQYPNLLNK